MYSRVAEQRFDVGEKHRIVGLDKFAHATFPVYAYKCGNVPANDRPNRSYNTKAVEISEENAVGVVVPLDAGREASEKLAPLLEIVNEDMGAINRIILDKAVSNVEMIPELAHHLIDSGGKRLRPMLAVASSKLCGYEGQGHVRTAAAIEFMHTATLLHDDVVDESNTRRGRKTARLLWGNQASVLVGDFLLGQAFRMLVDVGSLPVLKILSHAAATIAEGEVMQLAAAKNTATTEDDYLAIINAKTAALFSAAAEVGAAISARPADEQAALRSYGKNLGLAFQLVDDALDYSGDSAQLGKSIGDDFREGKITLPVILSFRRGSAEERAFWKRTIADGDIGDGDLEHAIALMRRHKALEATLERARSYGTIARDALAIFRDCREKSAMQDVIAFCVTRGH
jgi:octaprenyl-diphosphate synthase